MRRVASVLAAAIVAAGGVWAAHAATNGGTTPAKCIDTVWRTDAVSTTSTTFTDVPGMSDDPSSIFPIVVNASAVVSGAPVEFRLKSTNVGDQTEISKPGRASFVPDGGGPDSDSFSWAPRIQLASPQPDSDAYAALPKTWDAKEDFSGPKEEFKPLNAWEKVAQVLLLSNEMMFVD